MAKVCVVTGKKTSFGNNVSHSKRRTNRRFEANTQSHRIYVPELSKQVRIDVSARGLRIIDNHGRVVQALRSQGKTLREIGIR